jgi:hypothetical protein
MIENLYTFGCSYTKDNYQKTWADLVAQDHGLKLHNLAERGAGADFVVKRLLVSDIDPKNSAVMIMWPSADRFDLWADANTPHLVQDQQHASWPDGIEPKLVDYHGHYNHQQGFVLNGSVPRGYKHYFFKYFYSAHWVTHNWYVSVITAQLYLKSQGIKFCMSSTFPLTQPVQYHHEEFDTVQDLFGRIDQSCFDQNSITTGFVPYCIEHGLPFINAHYPDTQSHRYYIDNVLKSNVEMLLDK